MRKNRRDDYYIKVEYIGNKEKKGKWTYYAVAITGLKPTECITLSVTSTAKANLELNKGTDLLNIRVTD